MYSQFDAWIWCLPSERGLIAAEFAVSFPATVIAVATVQHPDIIVSLGSLTSGISVAFGNGDCQADWVWTHHVTCLTLANTPDMIRIIPHPATMPPAYQFANCLPGYPIEPFMLIQNLYVNQSCGNSPPILTGAVPESPLTVRATVEGCVDIDYTGLPLSHFFKVRNAADPADSIMVTDADRGASYLLVLERQMTDGTTYKLESTLCGCCGGGCAFSEWEFLYAGGFEPASNIRFASLTSSIAAPDGCAPVQCEFELANNGAASCDSFDVELALILDWWPLQERIVCSRRYGGLDAGGTLADAFPISPEDLEPAYAWVEFQIRIDAPGEIEEWAELDNVKNIIVTTYSPYITSIADVPADDGGEVQITFHRSYFENRHSGVPNTYRILRRIGHADSWESAVELPGTGALTYTVTAPTVVDSVGAAGDYWSVFKVRLETILSAMPGDTVQHTSCPDSGYSVDNTGPTATLLQSCSASFAAPSSRSSGSSPRSMRGSSSRLALRERRRISSCST